MNAPRHAPNSGGLTTRSFRKPSELTGWLDVTPGKINMEPGKWTFGRLFSSTTQWFSGSMFGPHALYRSIALQIDQPSEKAEVLRSIEEALCSVQPKRPEKLRDLPFPWNLLADGKRVGHECP